MTARAYGLDTPRGTHWTASAACHGPHVDPDWWWPAEFSAPAATTRLAVHICRQHCPVRGRCGRWAHDNPPVYPVVLGGEHYSRQSGQIRPLPMAVSDTHTKCPYCREES